MGATGGFAAQGIIAGSAAYSQGQAAKSQADFASSQYSQNQKFAVMQGDDAIRRGDLNASAMNKKGNAEVASQRVAAAATGADVNSGSAAMLQSDTQAQSGINQLTIKNNAWREAMGYRVSAINAGASAQMAAIGGRNQMNNSILTGGMQAIGYGLKAYGNYSSNNGSTPSPKPTPSDGSYVADNFTMPEFGER